MDSDLERVKEEIMGAIKDLKHDLDVGQTELSGEIKQLDQKVEFRHEKVETLAERTAKVESSVSVLQQKQAAITVKVTALGAMGGALMSMLKDGLGIGRN